MNARYDMLMRAKREAAAGFVMVSVLLALAMAGVAAAGVWWVMDDKVEQAEALAKQANDTLTAEREERAKVDENAGRVAKLLEKQQEKAHGLERRLRDALGRSADCSLGADVGRVLRDVIPDAAATGPAAQPGGPAAPIGATGADREGDSVKVEGRDVSCKAVAEWATRNMGICLANAQRHQGLIDHYEIVRGSRVNKE